MTHFGELNDLANEQWATEENFVLRLIGEYVCQILKPIFCYRVFGYGYNEVFPCYGLYWCI